MEEITNHPAIQQFFSAADAADENGRRWRLILGQTQEEQAQEAQPGEGNDEGEDQQSQSGLSEQDQAMDEALEALYGDSTGGDLSDSNPDIARWLGDIRTYFPASVVQVMQQDALNKLNLRRLLNQPEFLEAIEPDVQLVANLLALRRVMPSKTKETAKEVVRQVVEQLLEQLTYPLEQAISGSLNRATRTRRPRHKEINWGRTVHANLKHYQADHKTVVPETLVGYGRKRSALRDVIIALDTSGSMATSVVYGSIYASVMASIPALATKLVMFDTKIVDLTDQLADPVELLFGLKLGGGTNIDRALGYCQQLVTRPRDTVLVLLTDLFEGGNKENMIRRVATLVSDGVQIVALLALNDQGAPRFDRQMAQELVNLSVPAFACTPQLFPDLMGAVLNGRDIRQWAATHGIVTAPDN
ncbi:VWA domain-containing protein [Candidatus Leptofilum sp.]|uniref:VWA domain-containing protein n=1 Tax=Candidatus Leptofilum sp. TaxID=3241576 RepID=UPI003B59C45F